MKKHLFNTTVTTDSKTVSRRENCQTRQLGGVFYKVPMYTPSHIGFIEKGIELSYCRSNDVFLEEEKKRLQ